MRGATWRSSIRVLIRLMTASTSLTRVRGRIAANSSPPSRPATSRRRRVSRRHGADLLQRLVADLVAEDLVDVLEPVDVEDEHRRQLLLRLDRLGGELVEVAAVRQPGERIDLDHVAELAMRGAQLGDACARASSRARAAG
jgi:hypothetical protein